jgi:hypothetical protein
MAEKKLTAEQVTNIKRAWTNQMNAYAVYGDAEKVRAYTRMVALCDLALQALAQPAQDVRGEALEDCKRVVQNLVSGYLIEAEALKKQGAVNGATYVHTHAMGAQAAANAIAALEGNTHG